MKYKVIHRLTVFTFLGHEVCLIMKYEIFFHASSGYVDIIWLHNFFVHVTYIYVQYMH